MPNEARVFADAVRALSRSPSHVVNANLDAISPEHVALGDVAADIDLVTLLLPLKPSSWLKGAITNAQKTLGAQLPHSSAPASSSAAAAAAPTVVPPPGQPPHASAPAGSSAAAAAAPTVVPPPGWTEEELDSAAAEVSRACLAVAPSVSWRGLLHVCSPALPCMAPARRTLHSVPLP